MIKVHFFVYVPSQSTEILKQDIVRVLNVCYYYSCYLFLKKRLFLAMQSTNYSA